MRKEIKKAHYDQRLPEGVVLTGGGAKMRDIDKFVRETLENIGEDWGSDWFGWGWGGGAEAGVCDGGGVDAVVGGAWWW